MTISTKRKQTADVKCYFCAQVSGSLIIENVDGRIIKRFQPALKDSPYAAQPGKPLRCLRCGGPVFIDDVRPVPEEMPPFQFRQRRPKQPKVVQAA